MIRPPPRSPLFPYPTLFRSRRAAPPRLGSGRRDRRATAVSAAPINLRRLGAEDASAYREIRLEALADSPHAFSSTLESEQGQPLERFAARLADDFVLGAFSGPHLVGVAGFYVEPKPKHRHKGMLCGMYVRPDHRAAGIGRKLVEAIIAPARRPVELLQLFV